MKIDWYSKLTSRKFWVAVIGFISPIMIVFNYSQNEITEVAAIVMGGASLIAYIIGEGLVDSSRAKSETTSTSTVTTIRADSQCIEKSEDSGDDNEIL